MLRLNYSRLKKMYDRYRPKKLLSNMDFTFTNIFKFKKPKDSIYRKAYNESKGKL